MLRLTGPARQDLRDIWLYSPWTMNRQQTKRDGCDDPLSPAFLQPPPS